MQDYAPSASFDLIVPVLNEAENLPVFFSRLQKLKLNAQVIFVDNGSSDGSVALLKTYPHALVIEHAHNEGYGASIIDGIKAGNNPHIVIIDADCEYPPECIPELIAALAQHDAVYASRFLDRTKTPASAMPWLKVKGNYLISEAFNYLFRQQVTDLYTGCKAVKRSCIDKLALEQLGFEHVLELSAKLIARNHTIHEIPVTFSPRNAGKSKMRHATETAKFFYWLLRYANKMRAGKL